MIEKEIWKDVVGYKKLYEVSNTGNIRNTNTKKLMTNQISANGYLRVHLTDKRHKLSWKLVHRLVAEAFIPNPENKFYIDHIDTNKMNNNVSNLRWVTAKENMNNPLTIEHLSESQTGRIISEEWKNNISKGRIGTNIGKDNPNSRKVICITTMKEFESMQLGAKYYNLKYFNIKISSSRKR